MKKLTKQQQLDALRGEMEFCWSCKELTRENGVIFDDGNPDADIMIIAEGAGADEEKQCKPLIGRCGVLIEQMLNGIGLTRKDTWRANCVACRPPSNRDPKPEEIKSCSYFLTKQVEIIQPKVLILLGKFAAQKILKSDDAIGKLVGQWYEFEDMPFQAYAMYHPSYILRNGEKLVASYQAEFQKVKDFIDENNTRL